MTVCRHIGYAPRRLFSRRDVLVTHPTLAVTSYLMPYSRRGLRNGDELEGNNSEH